MLSNLTDFLYGVRGASSWLRRNYASDKILFTSGATILEANKKAQIGWSLRRLLQRRAVFMVTDRRILIVARLLTPMAVIFAIMALIFLYRFISVQDVTALLFSLVLLFFLLQRHPFVRLIEFEDIDKAQLGSVRGITGRGSLLTLLMPDKSINIVPAQLIPDLIFEYINSQILGSEGATEKGAAS